MNLFKWTFTHIVLAFLLIAWSGAAQARPAVEAMPYYNFVEFNIAFVLGISLPLLIIIALVKPVLAISWRYPALLAASLLLQFYALIYLTSWQMPVLLIAAASFVLASFHWLIEQKGEPKGLVKLRWGIDLLFFLFVLAIAGLPEFDAFKLWLAYSVIVFIAALTVQWLAKDARLFSVLASWLLLLSYSVSLYLWLNVQLDVVWPVSLAIVAYSLIILGGCWHLAQRVAERIEQIKVVVNQENHEVETHLALLDPITNLPTFQQGLAQLKAAMVTQPKSQFVAVVFKPLNFSQVNKVLGHQNSDILLLQLAFNLQQSVRENELLLNFGDEQEPIKIARLQGLDFLMVCDAERSKHPTKIIIDDLCNQLCDAVPQAMSFKSFSLNFELAFGIAMTGHQATSAEQLVAQASDALLEAERSGQLLCYFDHQSSLYTEQQLAKMEKLRKDVQDDNLLWLAHPQIALSDKSIRGFELEIDWRARDGERLSKKEFNEIAEYSGEIYRLTKLVIKHAFELLSIMHKLDIKQAVAINLSSKDLLEPELADFIEQESSKHGIALNYLVIELDEKVLLNSAFRARMMVDQLKALGVKIAIDDFTGSYEALHYLRRTSIHQVKIDCGELNIDEGMKSEKTIVNALVNLIRKMDIPLVATGVNNREIEKSYVLMGGDVAQGQLLRQGLALADVEQWLTAWQARHQA